MGMTDVIVDFDVGSTDEDMHLSAVIDAFVEMQAARGRADAGGFDLMVRTGLGPAGRRLKHLVFQSREMADAFYDFWRTQAGR